MNKFVFDRYRGHQFASVDVISDDYIDLGEYSSVYDNRLLILFALAKSGSQEALAQLEDIISKNNLASWEELRRVCYIVWGARKKFERIYSKTQPILSLEKS